MNFLWITAVLVFILNRSMAQVSVNEDGSFPDSSAMLDVKSSSKGFLVPRMTAAERDAIVKPAKGLLIFCTDDNQYYSNKGSPEAKNWVMLSTQWCNNGANIHYPGGNVGIGISSPSYLLHIVGGDVKIGNSAGDARKLYFGDGASVYVGEEATDNRLGLSGSSLMIAIGGNTGSNGQVLTSNGITCSWLSPQVGGSGITDYVTRWTSSNALGTGILRDNGATVGAGTAPDAGYRLKSYGNGSMTAVYGGYDANTYGMLGSSIYGAYGQSDANHYGYMGNSLYGVYGQYSGNCYGYIGSNDYGIYGRYDGNHYGFIGNSLYGMAGYVMSGAGAGVFGYSTAAQAGTPGVYGYNSSSSNGTAYTLAGTTNAVVGNTYWGTAYHFGVFGTRYNDSGGPSAGVIGTVDYSDATAPWGALGFQDASSTEFAGYFSGNVKITGGINDGTNYGVAGSVLMSDGSDDIYWSSTAGLLGNGTTNYLPKYTAATTFGNSQLYDNGTGVGIGTTTLSGKLHVFSNSTSTAVYGQYNTNILGYLGSTNYGAYGQNSSTLFGYLGGSANGAYGQYSGTRYGYLGNSTYGAYAQYDANKIGYLGSTNYGAYGQNSASLYGYLGSSSYGAYGQNATNSGYLGSTNYGVFGQSLTNSGYLGSTNYGAYGQSSSTLFGYLGSTNYGAYGQYSSSSLGYLGGANVGAYGQSSSTLYGYLGGSVRGVYGQYDGNYLGYLGSSACGAYGQSSSTLYGYLGGSSYGAYGQYSSTRYGYMGNSTYGAYAQYDANIKGYLGNSTYGAYGQYNGNIYGCLGSSSYGVSGYHNTTGGAAAYFKNSGEPSTFVSEWAIDSEITNSTSNSGSGYSMADNNSGGIRAYSYNGPNYSFSIGGWNYNDGTRCSGVFGSNEGGGYWGALGYKNSGSNLYGGYFTSSTTGTGKKPTTGSAQGIGMGAWGDLMGADIHGGVYGLFVEGDDYGIYSKGTIFSTKPEVQLQDVGESEKAVLFANTSADVTVMTSGLGNLTNGHASILFDQNFRKVISSQMPVIITVTPMGPSHGVYVSSSDNHGFTVTENDNGISNINFSYIAVGRLAGYENPEIPQEIADQQFESLITQGLHDDSDTKTDGKGLYYQDGKLRQGHSPVFKASKQKK